MVLKSRLVRSGQLTTLFSFFFVMHGVNGRWVTKGRLGGNL